MADECDEALLFAKINSTAAWFGARRGPLYGLPRKPAEMVAVFLVGFC
jgi:hypothetical protein